MDYLVNLNRHQVVVMKTEDTPFLRYIDWIRVQLKEDISSWTWFTRHDAQGHCVGWVFCFLDKDDAMMFKLAWGGK